MVSGEPSSVRDVDAALRACRREGPAYCADQDVSTGQRPTAFWVPGLAASPWWPPEPLGVLEQNWREIRAEFVELRRAARPERISGASVRGGWEAYHLLQEGAWHAQHCALCPRTAELLRSLPVCASALGYAYFSVLAPGAAVAPHHGPTNAKLRGHLPLEAGPGAVIHVGQLGRQLEVGRALLFDDSYLHAVSNGEPHERVVLLVDLWHPELTAKEINSIVRVFVPYTGLASGEHAVLDVMAKAPMMKTIAGFLPCAELGVAAAMSTRWHIAALDEDLWRRRARDDLGITSASHGLWRAAYKEEASTRFAQPTVSLEEAREANVSVPLFKIVLLGDAGAGKTCLSMRLCHTGFQFQEGHHVASVGLDFKMRMVRHGQQNLRLQVWDIAGPERFQSVLAVFLRGAHAAFVCYSITDRSSFAGCARYLQTAAKKGSLDIVPVLVGCRCDLHSRRAVTEEEGKDLAASFDGEFSCGPVVFAETSSKTGAGVEHAAVKALQRWMERRTFEQPATSVSPQVIRPSGCRQSACVVC